MKKLWDLKNSLKLEEEGRGIIVKVSHLLLLGPFYTIQTIPWANILHPSVYSEKATKFCKISTIFDWQYIGWIIGGDFAKFCGFLRIYELWYLILFIYRSWDKVCVVLKGTNLRFYKDQKSYRSSPDAPYRGEPAMELPGGKAEIATDYTKKRHVFRLK